VVECIPQDLDLSSSRNTVTAAAATVSYSVAVRMLHVGGGCCAPHADQAATFDAASVSE
jgi:hypothetical protein